MHFKIARIAVFYSAIFFGIFISFLLCQLCFESNYRSLQEDFSNTVFSDKEIFLCKSSLYISWLLFSGFIFISLVIPIISKISRLIYINFLLVLGQIFFMFDLYLKNNADFHKLSVAITPSILALAAVLILKFYRPN